MKGLGWDVISDFYDSFDVVADDVLYSPVRGHG